MADQTEAQKNAEIQARVKGFNEELMPLLKKYRLALGGIPVLTSDGRIVAKPAVLDDSKENEPKEVPQTEEEKKSEITPA